MNKFAKLISDTGNSTLTRRASNIAQTAEIAQQNMLNSMKQKKAELELKLDSLTDLAPDTTDSLRPGSKDWDAPKWALEIQNIKQDLYFLNIQIKIAAETYNEYFTEQAD